MSSYKLKNFNEPVLLVDDEPSMLDLLSSLVSSLGYRAVTCESGEEALVKAEAERPFLILTDFKMPGLDGIGLCANLRKGGYSGKLALLTGYADKEMALAAIHVGFDEVLEKPFDTKVVKGYVKKVAEARIAVLEQELREVEEITDLFVDESKDLLSDLDQLLLRLEDQPLDTVVVDLLFRKVHSVKGGAGAIPQGAMLAELAHHFESVLSRVKKDLWSPGPAGLDLFLESADLCRLHLDLIAARAAADSDITARTQAAIQKLEKLKNGESIGPSEKEASANAASVAGNVAKKDAAQGSKAGADGDSGEDDGVFVASDKLDSFMKLSGEMVVLKNTFGMAIRDSEVRSDAAKLDKRLNDFLYALNKITDNLQEQIMSVRKVTLDRALSKLPRLVRQTAQDVGKKVQFRTHGFDLGVDKTIAKALSASLTHMVRNSIDHGVETPAVRTERGKNPLGTLSVSAREVQGSIQIIVEDDGGGIDGQRVLKKAMEKGLVDETAAAALSPNEMLELIFLPGFSTAEQVSAVSGRGVGMDVVRSAIQALGGRVTIDSRLGEGTKFLLDIPVPKTVVVEQTVVAESQGVMVAIPLQAISRIIPGDEVKTISVDGVRAFQHDNRTIRLIDHTALAPQAGACRKATDTVGSVIVLKNKSHSVGLQVDTIFDQLEAVIRPFDSIIHQIPGFCGTTLMGDDRIAYVVSPPEIISITLDVTEQAA